MSLRTSCGRAAAPLGFSLRTRPFAFTMPLKARITNPAFTTSSRQNISEAERHELAYPKEQPGDEPEDVLFNTLHGVRTVELNRPKKLNSLNGSMARKILPRLKEWEKSQMANVVIISGAGEKAFCAGGDVASLALGVQKGLQENNDSGVTAGRDFFDVEYRLDHVIATYSKPYVAYMDGITMGGGVGLSVHAPIRIATERTVFAMPETTIGFFTDVGASFFLPRMDGAVGTYLALTSDRLNGADVFHAGIATHYIESSSLARLTKRLAELQFKDYQSLEERLKAINLTIEEYSTGLPRDRPALLSGDLRQAIDRCFSHVAVEDILEALEREAGVCPDQEIRKWAEKTRATILERSPTSVRVVRRLMEVGCGWNIRQAFSREATVAENFMKHPDFNEGVTSKLINKPATTPNWKPASLGEVSDQAVDEFIKEGRELQLVGGEGVDGYTEYPFSWLGLPSEAEVRKMVESVNFSSFGQVMDQFIKLRSGKIGVAEKVKEILQRCCEQQEDGVKWTVPSLGLTAKEKLEYRQSLMP